MRLLVKTQAIRDSREAMTLWTLLGHERNQQRYVRMPAKVNDMPKAYQMSELRRCEGLCPRQQAHLAKLPHDVLPHALCQRLVSLRVPRQCQGVFQHQYQMILKDWVGLVRRLHFQRQEI